MVFALGETLLGLHEFPEKVDETAAFDARRPGLDHVAFSAQDRAELDRWRDRLQQLGVRCGEVKDAHYGSGLSFKDPDGLPLELFSAHRHLTASASGWKRSQVLAQEGRRRQPPDHRHPHRGPHEVGDRQRRRAQEREGLDVRRRRT